MDGVGRALLLVAVLTGHFGWWVFAYNRINATGLPRPLVKFFERGIFVPLTLLLPLCFIGLYYRSIGDWLIAGTPFPISAAPLLWYALFCLAVIAAIGPFWIYSRFYLIPPRQLLQTQPIRDLDLRNDRELLCQKNITKILARVPGNGILQINSVRKSLHAPTWPKAFDGFRIGHISDLHFTGQLAPDFYRHALRELLSHRPDLIAITGDIIDKPKCLPWIEDLLGEISAPHGCYFVLGNHDKRIADPDDVRQRLTNHGWVDLGSQVAEISIHGEPIILSGHELPWFGSAPDIDAYLQPRQFQTNLENKAQLIFNGKRSAFRIALAHSPDAIDWARRQRIDLLLAGHTHGGQIRFPGIGPIVAPSWYGSQFASGVFYCHPTLMHVSRGLAGVHPIRFRCHPEIAILELYSQAFDA